MSYDAANGCLVLLALICAACLPVQSRRAGMTLACVFALNWVHFVTSYWPHSLASFFWAFDLKVHNEDLWKVFDALTGLFALLCAVEGQARWAIPVWLLSILQLLAHYFFWEGGMVAAPLYYGLLDLLFWSQAAAIILGGGGAFVARVGSVLAVRRGNRRAPVAQKEAAE